MYVLERQKQQISLRPLRTATVTPRLKQKRERFRVPFLSSCILLLSGSINSITRVVLKNYGQYSAPTCDPENCRRVAR